MISNNAKRTDNFKQTINSSPRLARVLLRITVLAASILCLSPTWGAPLPPAWSDDALLELSEKYLQQKPLLPLEADAARAWVGRLFAEVGRRLQSADTPAPPAEDVALISFLYARAAAPPDTVAATPPPPPPPPPAAPPPDDFSDLTKGNEGFRQGVEVLSEMPISERLVMTGDITAGLQAATVTSSPDLTSAFGRARMNFVLKAFPGSDDGKFSDGYFFVQLRAAGGPSDTSAVGGPSSFTPLNDVASDRSRFNEGTSRGNIYLAKAFYQQSVQLDGAELRGRAGIINLTDFFDTNQFANNEARQFLNGAFVNGAAFKTGISAPGAMAEYEREPWLFKPVWLDKVVVRGGYALSQTERAFTSPLWAGEVEFQTTLAGKPGAWRVGGTVGNVADVGSVSTFHINADHWLSRNTGVFGRIGLSNSGAGSLRFGPVRWAYSGGFQKRYIDRQDRVSAWAVAFSHSFPTAVDPTLGSEKVIETYYRWQITRNVALSPDFQIVSGSAGSRVAGLHTVYGARLFFGY